MTALAAGSWGITAPAPPPALISMPSGKTRQLAPTTFRTCSEARRYTKPAPSEITQPTGFGQWAFYCHPLRTGPAIISTDCAPPILAHALPVFFGRAEHKHPPEIGADRIRPALTWMLFEDRELPVLVSFAPQKYVLASGSHRRSLV